MHIDAKPIDLKLTTPFRISRAVTQTAPNAIVQINHKDWTGYGEAAPDEFYGETQETVLACVAAFAGNLGDDPFAIEDIMNAWTRSSGSIRRRKRRWIWRCTILSARS